MCASVMLKTHTVRIRLCPLRLWCKKKARELSSWYIYMWKEAPRFQLLNSIIESHALFLPQSDELKVSQVQSVYPRWLLDLLAKLASPEGNGGCWQDRNVIPSLSETSCSCCLGSRCWVCVCIPAYLIFFVSSMQIGQAKGGPCLRAALK